MSLVAEILSRETELVSRLFALLEREYQAIGNNQTEHLTGIAKEKDEVVTKIDALEAERLKYLDSDSKAPDAMASWLAAHPADKAAATAWANLVEISRRAHEANQRNQIMVDQLLRRTNEALDVLLGQPAKTGQNLYSKAGQPESTSGRRIVDSA